MSRLKRSMSTLGLIVLFLVGLAYLGLRIVRIDPTAESFVVTMHLERSGGLLERSEVTYRGVPVGRVADIRLRPNGVDVDLRVDADARIPRDSAVRVAGLSVAGEQYVDFRPRRDGGPYLTTGAEIHDAETPPHFASLLASITRLAEQVDPDKIRGIFDEVSTAVTEAEGDLDTLLTGGDQLLAGLEEVLPETLRILRNGKVTLDTVVDLRDELQRIGRSGPLVARELKAADPDLRKLLDASPETLALVNTLLADIQPDVEALLHDLANVGSVLAPRTSALSLLFPELERAGGAMSALGGDRLHVLIDLYPRINCPYGTPERAPTEAGWPKPYLDAQCPIAHPELQQRGSYYVPRPADDPTRTDRPANEERPRADTNDWYRRYLQRLAGG